MKGSRSAVAATADAHMKRARLCRFLRILMFFLIFTIFTFLIYMQASDAHFLDDATHYFNITSTSELIHNVPIQLSELSEKFHLSEIRDKFQHMRGYQETETAAVGSMSEPELTWQKTTALLERSENALNWLADIPEEDQKSIFKFDTISYNEVHILHKLTSVLKKLLKNKTSLTVSKLHDLVHNGYQCNALQASQQELISKFIKMDICSEIEWYKVVQLGWPDARNILDIGANKGYLASLFVALWGGNGFSMAPIDIFNAAKRLDSWKDSRNPAGYCQDGYSHGIPFYCPSTELREQKTGKCNIVNNDLSVTSIDGSSYLTETLNNIIKHETPIRQHNTLLREGKICILHSFFFCFN